MLRYLGGTGLADVGDQAWIVILAYAAASTGNPLTATLTVAAGTVPRAVLDLVGGAIADRLPTRPLLGVAAGARVLALVLALIALIRIPDHAIWIMVGLAILFGAADAIHKPAIGTLPRQLVPLQQLVKTVGYRQLLARSALLVGPALAGVVLGAWALKGALGGLIALFAVAALLLGGVRARYQRELSPRQSVVASTREVIGYLRSDARARALTFTMIGLNFFVIPVISAGIALRVQEKGWGVHALGLLTAAIGVGAVLGNLISLRLKPTYPMRFALIMLISQGFGLALAGMLPMVGAGIALALVGFTAGVSSPMLGGTTQAIVQESYLGRVYALFGLADDALIPFALIGYGALAGLIGVGPTTVICGIAMAVLMSVGLFRRPLRTLRLDQGESAESATMQGSAADDAPADAAPADDAPVDADEADLDEAEGHEVEAEGAESEGPEAAGAEHFRADDGAQRGTRARHAADPRDAALPQDGAAQPEVGAAVGRHVELRPMDGGHDGESSIRAVPARRAAPGDLDDAELAGGVRSQQEVRASRATG